MKRFILTKDQLKEFVEKKNSEKIFYEIVEAIHNNEKYLNENFSLKNANQSIIDNYNRKGSITSKVNEMLIKHKIINKNYEII